MWVCADDDEPVRLTEGDVVVRVSPDSWTIADDPDDRRPGPHPTRPGMRQPWTADRSRREMDQGVRSWGNSADGETVLLTGVYLAEGE
jgi:hypothetical protein